MKFYITALAVFIAITTAAPSPQGSTSNELVNGGCKKVTLVYARASTEVGNMVREASEKSFQDSADIP